MNTFSAYCSAVRRFVGAEIVNAHLSEMLSMFRCRVSPRGAAAHLLLSFNRK